MASNIHVLMVGINQYINEQAAPPLDGCAKDVASLTKFINDHRSQYLLTPIPSLIDEEATKLAVVKHFRHHFNPDKIKPGDIVLFYFAGHGSLCHSIFQKGTDEMQLDETFVCHDSRANGHYDLADKEIKVLLSEIPDHAQIVLIADSCHSGGIGIPQTKEDFESLAVPNLHDKKIRKAQKRIDNSYFFKEEGKYMDYVKTNDIIPSNYLLIASCKAHENAQEDYGRGLFTYYMMELLEELEGNITYNKLKERLTHTLAKRHPPQTPVFRTFGEFDMDQQFLVPKDKGDLS